MKTIILAGGLGTRLAEETSLRPKPMVEIGGRPILWHIMQIYAAHGHNEFVVACGYKGELIKEYFRNFRYHDTDITINLRKGEIEVHSNRTPDWTVTLLDTGQNTQTGGRVGKCREAIGREPFMLTYGDGVGNVDITALTRFHRAHGKLATVTAVRPPARFGDMIFEGNQVVRFNEKPQTGEGWINGGFFVLEPQVMDMCQEENITFERDVLPVLARDGNLMAYHHEGFWQPMDTLREKQMLETMWQNDQAPWKTWK